MSDAFRDDLDATRLRVDQLAEENAELQEELAALAAEAGESDASKTATLLAEANASNKRVEKENKRLREENEELLGTVTQLRKELERTEPAPRPSPVLWDQVKTMLSPLVRMPDRRPWLSLTIIFAVVAGLVASLMRGIR